MQRNTFNIKAIVNINQLSTQLCNNIHNSWEHITLNIKVHHGTIQGNLVSIHNTDICKSIPG
jgi:hypothetical protein